MVIELLLILLLFLYILIRILIGIFFDFKEKEIRKINRGLIYLKNKDFEKALFFFNKYLITHPRAVYAYTFRAKCFLGLKQFENAIDDSSTANSYKENIPEAFLFKGIAHYKLNQFESALIDLNKAVRYLKNNAEAFKWRGLVYLKLNKNEKANIDFEKSRDLGDEDANFILNHHYFIEN